MSTGDIHVFGLVAGTHVLEDIQMDVPHGATVTIPADKASRSKDLWRAISQKLLFQLQYAPGAHSNLPPATAIPDDILKQRVRELEHDKRRLEADNAALKEQLKEALAQQAKLDTILTMVQQGVRVVQGTGAPARSEELADGSAPQFIPTTIAPTDAESHIGEAVKKEIVSTDVANAAGTLRKIRKKQ